MIRAFHHSDGMHRSGFLVLFQILFSIYIVPNHSVYTAYRVDGPWALIVLEYENDCTPNKIVVIMDNLGAGLCSAVDTCGSMMMIA